MGFENDQVPRHIRELAKLCQCHHPEYHKFSTYCQACGKELRPFSKAVQAKMANPTPVIHPVYGVPRGRIIGIDFGPVNNDNWPYQTMEVTGTIEGVSMPGPQDTGRTVDKVSMVDGVAETTVNHAAAKPMNTEPKYLTIPVPSNSRVIPDWVWMNTAEIVSHRSTCTRLQVGAVIVANDGFIVSTGYNGAARGASHCSDVGCLIEAETGRCKRAVHAEANAIMQAGIQGCRGATLYVTHLPCPECSMLIANSGIGNVVYGKVYGNDTQLTTDTRIVLVESGVQVTQWQP